MYRSLMSLLVCLSLVLAASSIMAQETASGTPGGVNLKISGPGAVDQSTIKAGEKVSVEFYLSNDKERRGIEIGFKIMSEDIQKVVHVADSGRGLNPNGDVKGYNGWENKSVFDFYAQALQNNWDGNLPDTGGFVGIVIKKRYLPHAEQKCISWDLIVPSTGTLVIDSCSPAGDWMYDNNDKPTWGGPYTFKVVK